MGALFLYVASFTTANWHSLYPSPLKTQHSVLQKTGTRTLPVFRYSTVTSLLYQLPLVIVQVILFFISYCSLQKCSNTKITVPQNVSIFY